MPRGSGRFAPALLTALSTLTLVSLFVGGPVGEGAFAVLAVLLPVALLALGTRGGARRVQPILIGLGLVLAVSALAVVLLPAAPPASRVLGLPVSAWIALAGLGLVPFVIVVLGHAATFRASGDGSGGAGPSDD